MKQLKQSIIAAITNHGGTVLEVGKVKPPMLLVGMKGANTLLALKDGTKPVQQRHLTESELSFFAQWRGRVRIANSVAEALNLIGATKE